MSVIRYRRGVETAHDQAFEAGRPFGHIRMGQDSLFFKKGLFWYMIGVGEIARAYLRVEQVTAKTCCCDNDFSIHRLILLMKDGSRNDLLIGDCLYRGEPQELMNNMRAQWPGIEYGKPKEN